MGEESDSGINTFLIVASSISYWLALLFHSIVIAYPYVIF